jgi:hypothetical protein
MPGSDMENCQRLVTEITTHAGFQVLMGTKPGVPLTITADLTMTPLDPEMANLIKRLFG